MIAGTYNIVVEQGVTYRKKFVWRAGAPSGLDNKPPLVDVTGYSAHMQVRSKVGTPVVLDLHSPDDIVLGGVDGSIIVYIADEVTAGLSAASMKYDLNLHTPSGDVVKLLKGSFKVTAGVTVD